MHFPGHIYIRTHRDTDFNCTGLALLAQLNTCIIHNHQVTIPLGWRGGGEPGISRIMNARQFQIQVAP